MTDDLITKIEKWDNKVFLGVYKHDLLKRSFIRRFAKVYSFFGNMYFWGVFWLFLWIYGYIFMNFFPLALVTGGFFQSIIIHVLIRYKIVARNRPFVTLEDQGVESHDELIKETKSFPSGHVAFFLFFGYLISFCFNQYFWEILSIFILLDIVMAITRMILGVHYPTDVIFGFVFGFVYALLYYITHIYWVMFFYWLGRIFLFIVYYIF